MDIPAKSELVFYPLTSSQCDIWLDQSGYEGRPLSKNMGGYVDLRGPIDAKRLVQAVNLLVQKHDALRTILARERDRDGFPRQMYAETLDVCVRVRDFSGETEPEAAALAWMQARFEESFDLYGKPLFRYDLLKLGEARYFLLQQYHRLIIDGWGILLLNRSLAEIYSTLSAGKTPDLNSPSYRAYIENDCAYRESTKFEQQRDWWTDQYAGPPEMILTPRYRAYHPESPISGGCEALYLPRTVFRQLQSLAEAHGSSVLHVLLGALYVYFTRTAQRDAVTIGLSVLNRSDARFKQTAGLFAGVSPLRFAFGRNLRFRDLLKNIATTLKSAYPHQRFPISEINRALGLEPGRSRLFEINLCYENYDDNATFDGIESRYTALRHSCQKTPLAIYVRDTHDQRDLRLDFVYNRVYFETEEIKALQGRFVTLLEKVLEDGSVPLQDLPILTEEETEQLIAWNQTDTNYPENRTIINLFEEQVEKTPDHVALVFEDRSLTYAELNRQANRLAHYLLGLKTEEQEPRPLIQPDTLIAICVERSPEMVIGLLGILKAGAAYVPIDPDYPEARIEFMVEECVAKVLLTRSALIERFQRMEIKKTTRILCLDNTQLVDYREENPARQSRPDNLAYVIFTSGSTGKPKGVMIEHRGLVNLGV
ncbi:MAG: non-ribosomal peptide synthetase, partial [Gammaproteobacteria bacterium]